MNGEKSLFFYIGLFPDFVNHDQGTDAGSYASGWLKPYQKPYVNIVNSHNGIDSYPIIFHLKIDGNQVMNFDENIFLQLPSLSNDYAFTQLLN
jgi:hypothetical protein